MSNKFIVKIYITEKTNWKVLINKDLLRVFLETKTISSYIISGVFKSFSGFFNFYEKHFYSESVYTKVLIMHTDCNNTNTISCILL